MVQRHVSLSLHSLPSIEMHNRLKDKTLVFKAFDRENSVTIDELIETYPELKEAKLLEVNKIMLEGMDLTTYEKSKQNQINQLHQLIEACHGKTVGEGLHPSFVKEILNSNNEIVTKMHQYHLDQDIYRQSLEHASLASCVSYFARLFCDKKEMHDLIMKKVNTYESSSNKLEFVSNILKRKRHNFGGSKQGNDDSEETVVKKPSRNDFAFDHELKR